MNAKFAIGVCAALLSASAQGDAVSSETFTPRLSEQRLAPIGREGRTPAQEKMLANRPDFNIYKTLAYNPELYSHWGALGQYLLNRSTLPPRDREIVILRMGWLCQAPYEWSQHARIAKADVKMTDDEIHRIAVGASAPEWSEFDRVLLRMVDEIRYDAMISDKTWAVLRTKYSLDQAIDAMYTASQYQLVSMALNSLGVQLDPSLAERIPTDVPLPAVAGLPERPRLTVPRVPPLTLDEMSVAQRELVAAQIRDGKLPNIYATLARHERLYEPRLRFGRYLQRESQLPAQTRELLIMRTAYLHRAAYEWAHHAPIAKSAGLTDAEIARIAMDSTLSPTAKEWNAEQRALLAAADELRRETFISQDTWATLSKHYTPQQLLEIVYTVGGYAMTAVAINSLGIQVEAGYDQFPHLQMRH